MKLKEMIEGALDELGGQAWLVQLAKDDPGSFSRLLAKLLPKDLNVSGEVRHSLAAIVAESYKPEWRQHALTDERTPKSK